MSPVLAPAVSCTLPSAVLSAGPPPGAPARTYPQGHGPSASAQVYLLPPVMRAHGSPWQVKARIACKTDAIPHQTQGLSPLIA